MKDNLELSEIMCIFANGNMQFCKKTIRQTTMNFLEKIFEKSQAKEKFELKGNRSSLRMDNEMCSINKNEADNSFKLYKKQYIDTLLKSNGFYKYKTNAYIRRNKVDILEFIEFQKGRYGSRTFTVNCALTPLYIHYNFPDFISMERIGTLICNKDTWWDYANEKIAKVSFENVAKAIKEFVLPWFEVHSSDEAIKNMLLEEQDKRHKIGWDLSVDQKTWLELVDHHNDCNQTIEDNIKLFGLPKSLM